MAIPIPLPLRWRTVDPPEHIDIDEHHRRRVIAEAEYQAALDEQSTVLRVSGKVTGERRQVAAVVVMERAL